MGTNSELLVGLSIDELEALADTFLAPAEQHRMDELLERSKEQQLSSSETSALDGLLRKVDYLTILKARAKLTLREPAAEAARA